ncbi:AsmA family protein [Sediminibacterium sp.]|uniref:AsmA family protein n=1 Tax=Sediminibacterium sp. TaxID=1917865 RepID=UPI0027348AF5|nr:AsmA family protein [Sediminibacterium sp.]MDP3567431.1 AsmA-like C-terminal region-containing protein [Sediminibacterium sp.]
MTTTKPKKSLLRRILKWSGISILLIIVLLIAAPFIFKDKIIAIVKEQANNNLNAKVDFGEFDLTLISSFPDFRFKINNVSVIGVSEFKDDTLAFITNLSTDINLKSVLSGGPYGINSIVIDKARILGKVLKDGKANWDIAKPSADSTGAPTPESTEPTKFAMKLKEFKIKEAYIVYDDQQGGMYAKLDNFNYDLNGDFTQDNFVLNNLLDIAKTTFKMDGVAYLNEVHTHLKADLDMDMPKMKFTFKENEFSLNDLTLGFDGFVEMPDTNIKMDIKFKANQTEFKSILSLIPSVYSKDFASIKTSGKFAIDGYANGTYNASQMPAFGINLSIKDAMFKYPSLPKSVNNINIDVKVLNPTGVLDATTIDVNRFHVELAGNPIDITAHVKTPISDPGLRAELKGIINLGSVKEFIPTEKGDDLSGIIKSDISIAGNMSAIDKKEYDKFKASGSLEIDKMNYKTATLPYEVFLNSMILKFTTQYVELAAFDVKMGKSDIQASGKIENFMQYVFKDDLIKGSFGITSKLMDLNELMGPEAAATESATASSTAAPTSTASTGVAAVPANIDFNLDAKIGKVIYTNLILDNMAGNIVVRNQKVDMTNLRMNTMGGALTINGFYETSNIKKPTTGLNLKVENFDIQETFKSFNTVQKLAPVGQYATGKFTASLENFNTSLNENMEPDLNAVKANGVFKTDKVNVGGFPPFMKLGEALKMEQLKSMDVSNLLVNYQIKDGRVVMAPFDTKISNIPTNIEGSTGFDQTIDYKWKMVIPKAMFGGAANSALTSLLAQGNAAAGTNVTVGEKINVTALFGGTVMKPTVKTSLKDEAKSAVSTVTTQALNAGIDKAAEEAQKILEDAKAQCAKQKAEAQVNADKTKVDGYAEADKLVEQAGNPIAKIAAKKAAEAAKKKVDEKVQKIVDDAEAKCQKSIEEAQVKAAAKAAESKK